MRARDTSESRELPLNRSITVELENKHEQKAKSHVGVFKNVSIKDLEMKDFIEEIIKEVCTREHRTVEEVILLKGCLYLMFACL